MATQPDISAMVAAAVQDALASMLPGAPGNEVSKPETAKTTPRKTTARKGSTRKTTPKVSCITAGDAWNALGADATYEPKDKTKPANNAQLWRLNQAGMLTLK